MVTKRIRKPLTPVQRVIVSHERVIKSFQNRIDRIRRQSNEEIAELQSKLSAKQSVLAALKKGDA